ncbi:MAG: hypothetical protein AMK72_03620 [Planctomycetes bacterium SM23_25]|nr:MAG: hypothetical protein AMK72_03620 [Planctomycetes bacterium SM23_25]
MKWYATVPLIVLCVVPPGCTKADRDAPPGRPCSVEVDDGTRKLLEKINSVSAYEVPDLGLRKDTNYAYTPPDVEPFRHVRPFKEHFLTQLEYTGPGRARPEPEHVDSVKIGFIGPIMATVSVATGGKSHEEALGIKMLQGSRLAIEEANAQGGYLKRRIPFELVVSNDNGLWGASGNEIVRMAYKDRVWAILGTIDGANSHIAIRVALKAEILMMNSGDTDPTFIETNIPWVVRCIGDDRQQGYLLVDYLYRKLGLKRVGVIRASNRYGRFGVREIRDASRRLGRPIVLEMAYEVGGRDFSLQLDRLKQADVQAVVHWGDAEDGARILNQARAMGMDQPYFGCDRCVCDRFVEIAGAHAEGVVCTYPWNPDRKDPRLDAFRTAFRKRFGEEPETYAAHAYDGMNMILRAIQVAGLNRAKIRDVLACRTKPWPGVTGDIPLSAVLDDVGEVFLAKRTNGSWKYHARRDLGLATSRAPSREQADRTRVVDAEPDPRKPFFDARTHVTGYAGPGRDDPEPADIDEIRIGYFGPSDAGDPCGGDLWRAAQWAVDQANARGGYRGKPFRLVPAWSQNPWGTGVAQVARMVYQDRVWALIGGIDGPSTHLAEQVAVKARVALISPASTDKTVNLANVPWMFSCLPGDHLQAAALAAEIRARPGEEPFVLVSADDHDSHLFAVELKKCLARHRMAPRYHFQCRRGAQDAAETAGRIADAGAGALVLIADARDSACLLRAVRDRGYQGAVFGGPAMGRRQFIEAAGPAATGAVFPLLYDPAEGSAQFARQFAGRFGVSPDYAAAHAYDAVQLLVAAIEKAGLNRARIRDAVKELSPYSGAAGTVTWDGLGRSTRPVRLATVRDGRVVPVAATKPAAATVAAGE